MTAPTLDIDTLNAYTMSDKSLQKELFAIFFEQAGTYLDQMKSGLEAGGGWKEGAHAIKGSARAFGLIQLGNLCERAESGERTDEIFSLIQSELKSSKTETDAYLVM